MLLPATTGAQWPSLRHRSRGNRHLLALINEINGACAVNHQLKRLAIAHGSLSLFPYQSQSEEYGMKLFIGLDVSLAKTAVCVINEHGKIAKEAQVPSEPQAIVDFANTLDGVVAIIGLEAGPLSQWLHRGLTDARLDVVLMETRQVKGALKAMPIKTDRRDAEGIARLLHLGWFRPVHCKSVSAQEVRALLSARKAIQQGMITLELALRGLLRNFGLKVGTISRGQFDARIRELVDGNAMLQAAAGPMLRARASLRQGTSRARTSGPSACEG